ncbi:MAG: PEP/pyruvate-binding domain-containing protein, partial [Desulforhopalus sp.]
MTLIYSPDTLRHREKRLSTEIGGKCMALFQLSNAGFDVPRSICIGTHAYDLYVDSNHLREKINLELHRKEINEMRWEEIWDISLRIQNLFVGGKFPEELYQTIKETVHRQFRQKPLVVRSSSPGEDSRANSFAGLHESYINIGNFDDLLKKIKKVWASLWSDRAILYRQELGLDTTASRMAVIVQEFIEGESSGVMFTRSPLDSSHLIIEAVHGLNQGLVDGSVDPDRWTLYLQDNTIQQHSEPPNRKFHFVSSPQAGTLRQPVAADKHAIPPLAEAQVKSIATIGQKLELFFAAAQDVEWTVAKGRLYLLQSRPVTTGSVENSTDKRSWYLSLNRSYDNLLQLWDSIVNELLPEMDRDSRELAGFVLTDLSNSELAQELEKRSRLNDRWVSIYWSEFIPFAHGVRLFGELYNDLMEPDDPFEFVSLLARQEMLSTKRNAMLYECASVIRRDDSLRPFLEAGQPDRIADRDFQQKLSQLRDDFSMSGPLIGDEESTNMLISATILQYTRLENFPEARLQHNSKQLEALFVKRGKTLLPMDPSKLLELARASYRIRDDDNIHIGRIARELQRVTCEAKKRLR